MTEADADALLPELLQADPELPGIVGPQPAASYLAHAWRRVTGGEVQPGLSIAIYSIARVNEIARPPTGALRAATASDRDVIVEWAAAFVEETGADSDAPQQFVDRSLGRGRLWVWEDHGPVCAVATAPPIVGVARLVFAYTPPAARGRGYATAVVAAVSHRALAAGATTCILGADVANPTSNSVYQAVGYRRCGEAQEYLFQR
jgi:predicted GNAT family acetyltransferase